MEDSALSPPNRRWLSDRVVGNVFQRAPSSRASVVAEDAQARVVITSSVQPRPLNEQVGAASFCENANPKASKGKVDEHIEEKTNLPDGLELRRQRNRVHQARYKMKQHKLVTDLEDTVQELKDEIQELKLKRKLVAYGVQATGDVWSTTVEFFRLFRFGVEASASSPKYQVQRRFLLSTMTEDVTDGVVHGVDALLKNWAFQLLWYQNMDIQPFRLENEYGDTLVARTKGTLVITESTLRHAFPHLLTENEHSRLTVIAEKMLDQKVNLQGSVRFKWVSSSGRVSSVISKTDILTPLLGLLGSLEDVSLVFKNARLSPEGRLATSVGFGD